MQKCSKRLSRKQDYWKRAGSCKFLVIYVLQGFNKMDCNLLPCHQIKVYAFMSLFSESFWRTCFEIRLCFLVFYSFIIIVEYVALNSHSMVVYGRLKFLLMLLRYHISIQAKKTLLMRHEADSKSNVYWLGLLAHLQSSSVPRKVI